MVGKHICDKAFADEIAHAFQYSQRNPWNQLLTVAVAIPKCQDRTVPRSKNEANWIEFGTVKWSRMDEDQFP